MSPLLLPLTLWLSGAVTVDVDVQADRRAISPDIYGVNYGADGQLSRLGLTVRRWGGNSTSRYDWQQDSHNTGSDYFFENIPDRGPSGSANSADGFIRATRAGGAEPLITVTTLGWKPKANSPRSHPFACGFKVSKYGAQQATDPYDPDCGNGVRSNGSPITGNDPRDTSDPAGPADVTAWLQHLSTTFGSDRPRWFALDNEPSLWSSTHRDVHPAATTFAELKGVLETYGPAIKQAVPDALVFGPVEWGWTGFFQLTYPDPLRQQQQLGDFVPWYLDQAAAWERAHGQRILDVLDLHWYPQGDRVFSDDISPAVQALRMRSTQALWDPTYVDESWIGSCCNERVRLLPRMKEWVAQHYPGTRIGLSEYAFGAIDTAQGAVVQAELLGIFGREGLDVATLWTPPAVNGPGEDPFLLFRNYDGRGARFGETHVASSSADAAQLSAHAAQRADGTLTVVLVNRTAGSPVEAQLALAHFAASGTFRAFRFGTGGRLAPSGTGTFSGGRLSRTVPGSSVELVEFTPAAPTTSSSSTSSSSSTTTSSSSSSSSTTSSSASSSTGGSGRSSSSSSSSSSTSSGSSSSSGGRTSSASASGSSGSSASASSSSSSTTTTGSSASSSSSSASSATSSTTTSGGSGGEEGSASGCSQGDTSASLAAMLGFAAALRRRRGGR